MIILKANTKSISINGTIPPANSQYLETDGTNFAIIPFINQFLPYNQYSIDSGSGPVAITSAAALQSWWDLNAFKSVGGGTSNADGLISYKFSGKTYFALGDSFTANNLWQPEVTAQLGLAFYSDGIGGSCIAGGTANAEGDGTSRTPIVDRIDAALSYCSTNNLKGIVIEGGSNDWYYNTPMGDITSTDTTTYFGALNYIASKLTAYQKELQIIFVTLTQRNSTLKSGGAVGRVNYQSQELRANAMIQVASQYGIAVCDMFHGSGITYENSSVYTVDGTHPKPPQGTYKYGSYLSSFINNPISTFPNIGGASTPPTNYTLQTDTISWTGLTDFTFTPNTLTYTNNAQGWHGVAQAQGNGIKPSGKTGEIISAYNPSLSKIDGGMIGLSPNALTVPADPVANPAYNQIKYAIYNNDVQIKVFELGTPMFTMAMPSGSVSIKITATDTDVKYYVNGTVIYTSTQVLTFPLLPVATASNGTSQYTIVNATFTRYVGS